MLLREYPFLGKAVALSLVLHAALIAALSVLDAPAPSLKMKPDATVLKVELPAPKPAPPAVPAMPAQPPLLLPETARRNASAPKPVVAARQPAAPEPVRASGVPQRLEGAAARSAMEQLSRELFYPPEAVERGLQGEALVLLFLDASGNAIAARLEASSGHALLDDAAVKAARTLRSLPASAPREALLPVRFRLK